MPRAARDGMRMGREVPPLCPVFLYVFCESEGCE